MKIKLFGISIFEYQPHETNPAKPSGQPVFEPADRPVMPPGTGDEIPNQKSFDELFTDSSGSLPTYKSRRNGRRLDIEASLDLYGITDPNELWNHKFKPGSAGHSLRAALGAAGLRSGRKAMTCAAAPVPLTASQLADKANLTPDILPRRPNGKLDVEAGLKLLEITDPAELWMQRTKRGTARHLLKQTIGSRNYHLTGNSRPATQGGKEL